MRTCNKCGETKGISGFHKNPGMADGYLNACKECVRAYDRSRGSLPGRVQARKDYQSTEAGKAATARGQKKYRLTHRKKIAAQTAVGNALRDGKLTAWPCLVCGEAAEAHHPDYDAPLDVVWLCTAHHVEVHIQTRHLNRVLRPWTIR